MNKRALMPADQSASSDSGCALIGVRPAAGRLGISVSKLYELLGSGVLQARKVGRSTLFLQSDLDAFIAALPPYQPQAPRRSKLKARRA